MGVRVILADGQEDQFENSETETFDFTIMAGGVLLVEVTQQLSELISAEETTGYRTYSPNAWVKAWKT